MTRKERSSEDNDLRHDSSEIVGSFARVRIIAFLICMIIVVMVLAYRSFSGQ